MPAGLLPLFNMSYSSGQIHKYSVALYKTLEEETGQPVGFVQCGNIRLATNRDRMDEYRFYAGVAKTIGVEVEFLTPRPGQGDMAPVQHRGTRRRHRPSPTTATSSPPSLPRPWPRAREAAAPRFTAAPRSRPSSRRRAASGWSRPTRGTITCEHVVSATGNHARQTGAMVGLDVPSIPVEHQFIVTEPHPEILKRRADGLAEMGVLRESDASYYMREGGRRPVAWPL